MHLRLALFAVLFCLICPATLLADTYEYQYSGPDIYNSQFTFFTDSLITSQTTVTPTSCSFNTGSGDTPCNALVLDAFPGYVLFEPTDPSIWTVETDTGFDFTQLGTQTDYGAQTLTITDIPSTSPTPEPSSLVLLGTGLLSFAGIARRRFAPHASRQVAHT